MRRIVHRKRSKRAITLVELIVAMTLTAIFASSCVLLIMPITKIYKHANDLSRAQLVADTVVDALRTECARTCIAGRGDVWIACSGASGMESGVEITTYSRATWDSNTYGNILIIRRNDGFCETISSNYSITQDIYNGVLENDQNDIFNLRGGDATITHHTDGALISRSVYAMFQSESMPDREAGYIHFGYFGVGDVIGTDMAYPMLRYDFANPFNVATYRGFKVKLDFSFDPNGNSYIDNKYPSWVNCTVTIMRPIGTDNMERPIYEAVYSRSTVLCFASPVVQ